MSGYNPYENMLNTLDVAAEKLGYTRSEYEVLRHPERELKVAVPLQLDNFFPLISSIVNCHYCHGDFLVEASGAAASRV